MSPESKEENNPELFSLKKQNTQDLSHNYVCMYPYLPRTGSHDPERWILTEYQLSLSLSHSLFSNHIKQRNTWSRGHR